MGFNGFQKEVLVLVLVGTNVCAVTNLQSLINKYRDGVVPVWFKSSMAFGR